MKPLVSRVLLAGALSTVLMLGPAAPFSPVQAACSSVSQFFLGNVTSVNSIIGVKSSIQASSAALCVSSSGPFIAYWAGIGGPGTQSLAQAGWTDGGGTSSPHVFDEFIDTNGANFGPYFHQAINLDYHFDTYQSNTLVQCGHYCFYYGLGYWNGNSLDQIQLDWYSGTDYEFTGESTTPSNHWKSYFSGAQYCTGYPSSVCTPSTNASLPLVVQDPYGNGCWVNSSNNANVYDKRDSGGHC